MSTTAGNSPLFGNYVLGTAGLGGVWHTVDPESSVTTILHALENGIRCIDTAPAYGDGESFVGEALRRWKGAPPVISTKAGRLKSYRADQGVYDYTARGISKSVENSLNQLGRSTIDLLFLHEPAAIPVHETEAAVNEMQAIKARGHAKKIGLGGNYPSSFLPYLDAGIFDVVMEYNRLNACCTDALATTVPQCGARGVEYWAASPLHMGLLGRRFQEFMISRPGWLNQRDIDTARGVQQIAEKNRLPLSSLAFRFLHTIPIPINIVLGPSNQQELEQTLLAIRQGPLTNAVYTEVLNRINELNNNKF